jgi:catechol 2,3-dioxygenase
LKLAGLSSAAAALAGAVRAEGGATSQATPALPFALTTPMHIDQVALKVRDMEAMKAYYSSVLGLAELERSADRVILGAGKTPLLTLIHTPSAQYESQSAAGLYHVAYLMPTRKDLARWLVHVAMARVPLTGFADHSVSEAIYLNDPEGNGIEVYSDRPTDKWKWDGDLVTMGTNQLDVDNLVALTDTTRDDYSVAPEGLRIGHMHLRVGDIAEARGFYETAIGLQSTRGTREDAAFLSSGHYHHHVGMNVWNSKGAAKRDPAETGLDWFSMTVNDKTALADQEKRLRDGGYVVTATAEGLEAVDPWGTKLRLLGV